MRQKLLHTLVCEIIADLDEKTREIVLAISPRGAGCLANPTVLRLA